VRWAGDRLDGRLAGENVRGEEKLRHLRALRERHRGLAVIAYGNASSDLPHLRECEVGVYVNASAAERATLAREGLRLVEWH
jgi:phosphoserine phosphatase